MESSFSYVSGYMKRGNTRRFEKNLLWAFNVCSSCEIHIIIQSRKKTLMISDCSPFARIIVRCVKINVWRWCRSCREAWKIFSHEIGNSFLPLGLRNSLAPLVRPFLRLFFPLQHNGIGENFESTGVVMYNRLLGHISNKNFRVPDESIIWKIDVEVRF